jgi:hypothetical protein
MLTHARATGLVKDFGLEELLTQLQELHLTGKLVFLPNNLEFYFDQGDLIAVRGGELLGSILLRLGAVTASQLQEALAAQGQHSLGQVLLSAMYGLNPRSLEDALHIQILRAVQSLFETVPVSFAVYHAETDLPIQTRLPVQVALSEVLPNIKDSQPEEFSSQSVIKLLSCMPSQPVTLEPDQWAVATLLDGRRTLETVAKLYQIQFPRRDQPQKRILSAVLQMYHLGLLELVEYKLDRILLKSHSGKQVGYLQQQFLLLANGQRNLLEIGAYLGLDTIQTAEFAVNFYRNKRLEVLRGVLEFERLLEQF